MMGITIPPLILMSAAIRESLDGLTKIVEESFMTVIKRNIAYIVGAIVNILFFFIPSMLSLPSGVPTSDGGMVMEVRALSPLSLMGKGMRIGAMIYIAFALLSLAILLLRLFSSKGKKASFLIVLSVTACFLILFIETMYNACFMPIPLIVPLFATILAWITLFREPA